MLHTESCVYFPASIFVSLPLHVRLLWLISDVKLLLLSVIIVIGASVDGVDGYRDPISRTET